ncbi:hypothetical protein [Anaeromassilibacillus senegalensis]|uniref:hypothetical protein n=1 Tax=Anaeromassilibacillus senegalensis TaxID=1673717 RepID=UPI0012B56C4D|nr:hypothetical protein [Anaeromassilibacillus senegalensis]
MAVLASSHLLTKCEFHARMSEEWGKKPGKIMQNGEKTSVLTALGAKNMPDGSAAAAKFNQNVQ